MSDAHDASCPPACSLPGQLDHLLQQAASLSLTLADAATAVGSDPASQAAVDAVQEVGNKNGGFFGPIATVFEATLKVGSYSRGISVHYGASACCGVCSM